MPRAGKRTAVLLAGLLLVTGLPLPWLAISEGDDLRYVLPGRDGLGFTLSWRHSVERQDWQEHFRLAGSGIRLVGTRFKTYGAGVPAGGESRLEDGWVVLSGLDRAVAPLHVQAGSAADYRLRAAGREVRLGRDDRQPILTFERIHAPLWRVMPPLVGYYLG